MAAKRSYKKRSYKKRGTIRKLKTTLRRKIQRGGNPALITPCIIIFMALFGNSPLVKAFITILEILAGMPQRGGNSKSFKQRGGDGRLSAALQEFNTAVQGDISIDDNTKQQIANCVSKLTSSNEPIVMPDTNTTSTPEEQAIAADTQMVLNTQNQVPENSATNTNNNSFIESIQAKYSGLIDKVNTYYVSKAEGLTSDKKECIKILLTAGFSIMKRKLSDITATDVIKAKAKAAAENLSQKLDTFKQGFGNIMNSAKEVFGNASQASSAMTNNLIGLKNRFGFGKLS